MKDNNWVDEVNITIGEGNAYDARTLIGVVESIVLEDPTEDRLNINEIRVTGDIGVSGQPAMGIRASSIRQIDIGGSIYGVIDIEKPNFTGGDLKNVIVDGMLDGGSILNSEGDIYYCYFGQGVDSSLSESEVWASGSINQIDCFGDFDGRIGDTTHYADVGTVSITGDFIHDIPTYLRTLFGSFTVEGDYGASTTLQYPLDDGILFTIGGGILADDPGNGLDVELNLPAEGLAGQVIVNNNNGMSAWDTGNHIFVGTTPLVEGYTELSAELGGGQAGLVPYNFHQRVSAPGTDPSTGNPYPRDCDPYFKEVVTVPQLNPAGLLDAVKLQHYGPVYIVNAGDDPAPGEHFHIEFYADYQSTNPQWIDRSSQFVVEIPDPANPDITDPSIGDTVVRLVPITSNRTGFIASGYWRITPKEDKVKCANVPGGLNVKYRSDVSAMPVDGTTATLQWYRFRVLQQTTSQMSLLNSGNGAQASDLSAWLIAPYETNADGETNQEDFVDMAEEMANN